MLSCVGLSSTTFPQSFSNPFYDIDIFCSVLFRTHQRADVYKELASKVARREWADFFFFNLKKLSLFTINPTAYLVQFEVWKLRIFILILW
jgi:hypothetical protein